MSVRLPTLCFAVMLTAVGCSATRSPATSIVDTNSWLCAFSPTAISLQELGVPASSRPIDLAISPEKVTVLLSPARLITFSRNTPQVVDMIVGQAGDSWRAIDRDPTDGSLWVASDDNVSLLRVAENGERTGISGPRVQGQGGFRQIRIGADAIYAAPTGSAANAVWRLSRGGKLLGQSFPQENEEEPSGVREANSRGILLARDLEGNVVGLDLRTGRLHRANGDGTWIELPERFPGRSSSHARSLRGEEVGTSAESWYFTDATHGFFFLPEGPTVLGSPAIGLERKGATLFRNRGGNIERAIEPCAANGLLMAISDSSGFVAVSAGRGVIQRSGAERIFPPQILVGQFRGGS